MHTRACSHTMCTFSSICTIVQSRNQAAILSLPFISSMYLPSTKCDQSFSKVSLEFDHSYPTPMHPSHPLSALAWSPIYLAKTPIPVYIHNVIKVVLIKCKSEGFPLLNNTFQWFPLFSWYGSQFLYGVHKALQKSGLWLSQICLHLLPFPQITLTSRLW